MTGIENKGLFICHLRKIFHCQTILSPVLESSSVTTVNDKFVRVLGNSHIEVVGNHQHDCCRLSASGGKIVDGTCINLVVRFESEHIDSAIRLEFFLEFRNKCRVMFGREISERISESKLLFLCCQNLLSVWCMIYSGIQRLRGGKHIGNTFNDCFLKISHINKFIILQR